jgi:hypothetical protein
MNMSKSGSMDDILERKVVTDQDVARLRRAYYADGIIDPQEAAKLFDIQRVCMTKSASWADCFIEMLTDYVVNQIVPEGYVTVENADWLIERVTTAGRIGDRTEFELVVNVIDKARWSPERLATLSSIATAMSVRRRTSRRSPKPTSSYCAACSMPSAVTATSPSPAPKQKSCSRSTLRRKVPTTPTVGNRCS